MAGILETVRPLVSLLGQARDPVGCAYALQASAANGADGAALTAQLAAEVTDTALVRATLRFASVLDPAGQVTGEAAIRLAQAAVLSEDAAEGGWHLVLTVPGFLRTALDAFVAEHGAGARPRETTETLREVANTASHRLVIAAPYLHAAFVRLLAADVERILAAGGGVLVVTRALALTAPERSSANVEAVTLLRQAADRTGRALTVRSWEESGLGIHFKVLLADDELAYLGSANLTPGGTLAHAETGVLLHGRGVAVLGRWLDMVCDELARRRLPAG